MNRFYQFVDKVGKRNFILIVFVLGMVMIAGLYQTFSLFTGSDGISVLDGVKTLHFILSDNEEGSLVVAAGSSKNVAITVSNEENIALRYGIYYSSSDDLSSVSLGYLTSSEHPGSGVIKGKNDYVVLAKIYNLGDQDVTIRVGILYGMEAGGDLALEENQHWLEVIYPYLTKVEYIESTGTQFIDTNYYPNQNTRLEMVATPTVSDNGGALAWLGGRTTNTAENSFTLWQLNDLFQPEYHLKKTIINDVAVTIGAKYTIDMYPGSMSINGTRYTTEAIASFSSPVPLTLFTVKNNRDYIYTDPVHHVDSRMSHLKLYSCKIWDNDTLVRDFIPVIDWQGVPCLYDQVEGIFYYNSGTSDFHTNYTPKEVLLDRNTAVDIAFIKERLNFTDTMKVTDWELVNSKNEVVTSTLDQYDVYEARFKLNGHEVREKLIPVPTGSILLTNGLTNSGFESDLISFVSTNQVGGYYNETGTPKRSSSIKRSGSYAMTYNCNNNQTFLRFHYGNIGSMGKNLYTRVYAYVDNSSLQPGLSSISYEKFVAWPSTESISGKWGTSSTFYQKWGMISNLSLHKENGYPYLVIQYGQANTSGVGNLYFDDAMAVVLDSNVWDAIPTQKWMDRMVPYFSGSQTFQWK